VCISQLSKIYTLPNIEIQEAFLKLREQAKCHYQNKAELNSGLDVINNTNLNYFGQQQKAEFYTLKGMFLNKLGQKSEANEAFGSALYFDIKLPKAWAEWGRYNDMLFKQDPKDIDKASSAVSCYLEAASLFKDPKTRKLLGRILWLLSLDNSDRVLSTAFGEFKGETPVWYWITFIPQLISGLSRPEAPIARSILNKIAKAYPQALFFQLRTSKEDMMSIKRQQELKDARDRQAKANQEKAKGGAASSPPANATQSSPKPTSTPSRPNTANGTQADGENGLSATPNNNATGTSSSPAKPDVEMADANGTPAANSDTPLKPWEHVDQVMNSLKSSFPLLAWSMESMVDQITKHFKSMPDEDAHRLIVALLNDGLSYVGRQPGLYAQDVKLPVATEQNISRFAESVCPPHIRKSFEADFVKVKPTMHEYIQKLRKWRNRFEEKLDRRATPVPLEGVSSHLSEFRFQKFDDVEVPGQYLQHKDKNSDFIRIERIMPDVDLIRGSHVCHRRLKIRGHDGSVHPFAVQHPTGRYCRREERILQLFRLFNETLQKRRETRRRNLQFNLPVMVPLSPAVRIIADDASYVTLQTVYEDYCRQNNMQKEDPILYQIEKLRALAPVSSYIQYNLTDASPNPNQKNVEQMNAIRLESFISIQENMVPPTVAIDYFQATYPSYADFWLFRRAFSYQFAALTFITYIMYMNSRYPHKLNISRESGRVWGTELVPTMGAQRPIFNNTDTVPFRLSPNLQRLMGPIVTEGIFAPALMAIARCLMEPEGELEMELSVFVRDEVMFWYTQQRHASPPANMLRESVQVNSELVIRRAKSLAQPPESGNLPANQTVVDLVANAVNPKHLSTTDPLWMAWL
jgi:transformation/transcription domain-associated protein